MVKGNINDFPFRTVLEPDGKGSHWFRIDEDVLKAIKAKSGEVVTVEIEPTSEWLEPHVPADLKQALSGEPTAQTLWDKITPNAHWDWIRWIRATKQPETRKRRIKVACSKLKSGTRRPCCFNRNICSEPYVSNNWVLLELN